MQTHIVQARTQTNNDIRTQLVTIGFTNELLREALFALGRSGNFQIALPSEVDATKLVNLPQAERTVEATLNLLLQGSNLEFHVQGNNIVLSVKREPPPTAPAVRAQPKQITGRIISGATRETLPGVTIREVGTGNASVSNIYGIFTIMVENPNAILQFNFIGMESIEEPLRGRSQINITMRETALELGEVVITGMFERRQEGFTGSAITITNEQIGRLTSGNALTALEMLDPGFRMNVSNLIGSNPNAIPDFQLRGSANFGDHELEDIAIMRGDLTTRPNQPLFVLDGVIGVSVTTIMDLNPELIESITVLKDAAATAIYGSEAANGVVIVETRRPIPGRLRVSYSGRFEIVWPDLSSYNLANAWEKLEIEKLAGFPDGQMGMSPAEVAAVRHYFNAIERDVMRGINTDWLRIPVRTVFTQRHNLGFEGGDQALRYKVHLGASMTPGVMRGTNSSGQSGRVDIIYRLNRIQILNQTHLSFSTGNRESNYGAFSEYALMNPYFSPFDQYGNIRRILDPQVHGIGNHDVATLNPLHNTLFGTRNEFQELNFSQVVRLEYRPTPSLRTELDFMIGKTRGSTEVFLPAHHSRFHFEPIPENRGMYSFTNSNSDQWRLSLSTSYHRLFGGAHLVSLFGRYTMHERINYNSTLTMTGFPNDRLSEVFMGTTFRAVSGSESVRRSLGFVFSGNYSYRQRYSADISVRIDASSQFGRNNRFAPFWATGLRWNAHNEDFFRLPFFDEFIIRGSIGVTGSQDFNAWQALQTYTYSGHMTNYVSSNVVGTSLLALGNPYLRWQQTLNQNIGLDVTMFDHVFGFRFEVYSRLTQNTLLDYTLAPSVGFPTIKENLGEISNRGYEFSVRLMPWRNHARRAYWSLSFNGAYNRSTIERISEALRALNEALYGQPNVDLTRPLPQFVDGASNTAIWGVRSAGICRQTGEELFITRNGEIIDEWRAGDRVIIGDRRPTLAGSITTTFAIGDFSITVGARYTFGGQIYNQTLADRVENANLRLNVDRRVLHDRWRQPGDEAQFRRIPRPEELRYFQPTRATSRFVQINNELNLSTLNISYRMSAQDHPALQRMGLTGVAFGLHWNDIVRFSTVRMEHGIHFPFARTISFSINATFS